MNNLPNKITIIRIALIPFILFFYLTNFFAYTKIVAMILFILASFTDFLDGYIARKYNMVTSLGKFLDPIADKLIATVGLLLIVCLGVVNIYYGIILLFIMFARDYVVSLLRQISATKGIVISADKWGKLKTISLSLFVPLFMLVDANKSMNFLNEIALNIFLTLAYTFSAIYLFLLIFSAINYLIKNKKVFY